MKMDLSIFFEKLDEGLIKHQGGSKKAIDSIEDAVKIVHAQVDGLLLGFSKKDVRNIQITLSVQENCPIEAEAE